MLRACVFCWGAGQPNAKRSKVKIDPTRKNSYLYLANMADCCHPVQRNIYFVRGHEKRAKQKSALTQWTTVQMSGGMRDCTVETTPTLNELFFQNGGEQQRYRPRKGGQQPRRRKKQPSNAWKEYHCRGQGQPGQECKYPDRKYTSNYDLTWKEQLTRNNPMKESRKPSFNPDGSIISYYNQRRTDMRPASGSFRKSDGSSSNQWSELKKSNGPKLTTGPKAAWG
jgi:hypothetical protein